MIRHHFRLVELAATKVMDEREFLEASNTMVNIVQAIKQRVEQLESMTILNLPSGQDGVIHFVYSYIPEARYGRRYRDKSIRRWSGKLLVLLPVPDY